MRHEGHAGSSCRGGRATRLSTGMLASGNPRIGCNHTSASTSQRFTSKRANERCAEKTYPKFSQGWHSLNQLPLVPHCMLRTLLHLFFWRWKATEVRRALGGTANTFLLLSIVLMIVVVSRQIFWLDRRNALYLLPLRLKCETSLQGSFAISPVKPQASCTLAFRAAFKTPRGFLFSWFVDFGSFVACLFARWLAEFLDCHFLAL